MFFFFGAKVNNYRLFRTSTNLIAPLIIMLDDYGNNSYKESLDYALDDISADLSIKYTTRKLNVTWKIRNYIKENYNFTFDKLKEIKEKEPLALIIKSYKYIDFKHFVLQKYFGEGVEDMFIQKSDVLNHLRISSLKNNKVCYYKEFEDDKDLKIREKEEKDEKKKKYYRQ